MTRKYKFITSTIASTLAIVAPIGAVVACGNNKEDTTPAKSWAKASRRNVSVVSATDDGRQPYVGKGWQFAPNKSNLSGVVLDESTNSISAHGFTVAVNNFPKYAVDGSLISGKVSDSHLEFALYDKVTLTLKDGSQVLFDSDSTDVKDVKSINGEHFQQTIAGNGDKQVTNLEFHLREGVKWVNSKGEEVAPVTTDDIWNSTLLNIASYETSRENSVGTVSGYLDQAWNQKYDTSFKPYSAQTGNTPWKGTYTSAYGLDTSPVNNNDKASFVNEAARTHTLKFLDGTEGRKIVSYWNALYANGAGPVILPTQLYLSAAKTISDDLINGYVEYAKNNGGKTLTKDEAKKEIEESDGWKTGFYGMYTFGATDFWSAGQYYTSQVSDKSIVFTQNKHFANQKWVALDNTILTYTYEYIGNSGDYKTAIYEGYKQGLYASFGYFQELPENVKKDLLNNPEKYGVYFTKGRTALSQVDTRWTRFNFLNLPSNEDAAKNFYFNDAFAKVAYGVPTGLIDLVDGDKAGGIFKDPATFAKQTFSGTGVEFRSSIFSAINWFTAVYDYTRHESQEWTSRLAPEQTLTPASGEKPLVSPIDVEDLYSSYGLGFQANVPTVTQVTHKERVAIATDTSNAGAEKRYLANEQDITELKKNVKHALDTAGIAAGEKVIFQLPHEYTTLSRDYRVGLEGIRKAINSLDSRLEAVSAFIPIDPKNPGDNPTDGSKTLKEEWRRTFSPDDATWTVLGPGVTDSQLIANELIKRIDDTQAMIPFAIRSGNKFEVDTLSQVWNTNLGYLQDGVLLALSYYRQHPELLPEKFAYLNNFAEAVGTAIDKFFDQISASTVEKLLQGQMGTLPTDDESKAKIAQVLTGLNHFEFNKVIDSNAYDLAKKDYFGFAGDTEWVALTDYINDESYKTNYDAAKKEVADAGENATDAQKAALADAEQKYDLQSSLKNVANSLISDVLNKQSEFEIRTWFGTITQEQKVSLLAALDTYVSGPWVLNVMPIGNRENLSPGLTKDWFHANSTAYHVEYLGSFRVDLD